MEIHFGRLKLLLKKRSIPGWILFALGFLWRRIADWQNVKWIWENRPSLGWTKGMVAHPNYVMLAMFFAALIWFGIVVFWPQIQNGPDVILGYDSQPFGGFLSVRNFGPGMIYNVAVSGIHYGKFTAEFDPIAFVASVNSADHSSGVSPFRSTNNCGRQKQIVDAVSQQSPESNSPDARVIIQVELWFDWNGKKHKYAYELECSPFQETAKFKRRIS